ncbi:hypothetical protein AB7M49_007060 [Bradyrhizobium elkanii]|jgi:hypothetical protein|uniref:Porin n=1 Tax=Bradyrhizobium elkanii TaxID=29448 RepID=A0A1E3EKS5_BRAEL|nr:MULTISPECIES: hypothetical protein [Bradyrhizobium]MBP1297811.1 hypothetical protein [Bradyrhizobium elkanii]MBP2426850.1 hypothetical protein [Bradyrhizobium elkanii]MCP1757699.1 hypothetical protein [Bradyrhizobium elkanii]MCP1931475.1 hypothetical protein [Bradyrhizobium elkanii]MCP1983213.1 hypothetical protein [Bradyrhizobium elkanii]
MRKTCIAIIAILLPAAALAQQGDRRNFQTPPDASKTLPSKSATRSNPCASYGPGFVKVEGSDTCVKLGGGISVDGGMSGRGR